MHSRTLIVSLLISSALICSFVIGQDSKSTASAKDAASPEMEKLGKAFVGDWDNTETMERSEYFPNGGGRHGAAHWRLGVGGTTVIDEGHSDGSAGPLDHLVLIWWDNKEKVYGYFVCFKDRGSACFIRGTAHWEGDDFVNDYEEMEHGKKTKWRDSFVAITPTSYTLIAAWQQDDGTMKTVITTRCKRR
jgi:hypothetical protein